MDSLLRSMQVIDKNSDKFDEGEYLEMCNLLKNIYSKRTDPVFFFEYENLHMLINDGRREGEGSQMFKDAFHERATDVDYDYLNGQIMYLQGERHANQPLRRMTKRVKMEAQYEFCEATGLDERHWEENVPKDEKNEIYSRYFDHENNFREKYREAITRRISWIEESIERLDDV